MDGYRRIGQDRQTDRERATNSARGLRRSIHPSAESGIGAAAPPSPAAAATVRATPSLSLPPTLSPPTLRLIFRLLRGMLCFASLCYGRCVRVRGARPILRIPAPALNLHVRFCASQSIRIPPTPSMSAMGAAIRISFLVRHADYFFFLICEGRLLRQHFGPRPGSLRSSFLIPSLLIG